MCKLFHGRLLSSPATQVETRRHEVMCPNRSIPKLAGLSFGFP